MKFLYVTYMKVTTPLVYRPYGDEEINYVNYQRYNPYHEGNNNFQRGNNFQSGNNYDQGWIHDAEPSNKQ